MLVACISDIHGDREAVRKYIDEISRCDVVVIAGDITNFGGREEAREILGMFPLSKVFAIAGNCDKREVLEVLEELGISIHEKVVTINNTAIGGVSGSNPTPFSTPFELSEEEIWNSLSKIKEGLEKARIKLLVTHAPPYGVRDKISTGVSVGSRAVRMFIDANDVNYLICGHIHEAKGVEKFKETTVINCGTLSTGFYVLDVESGSVREVKE